MLKRRLIPVLNIMNGLIVRSEIFKVHKNIGNIINQANRYNEWEVDELIYLDISRTHDYDIRRDDHKIASYNSISEVICRISQVCSMPLSIGGNIRTIEDAEIRINSGADKVIVNTGAFEDPSLITKIANKFGTQAVILNIDYKIEDSKPVIYTRFGKERQNISIIDWVKKGHDLGAGEIFLKSIDNDGMANGFDIKTINIVDKVNNMPVIACGGAGDDWDFVDVAKETDVSAIAAGNIFHFTERSYPRIKNLLKKENVNVR